MRARLAKYVYTIKAHHTSPSRKTITQKGRKKKNPAGRCGRHKGHRGVSAGRKVDYTMHHMPDRCDSCRGEPGNGTRDMNVPLPVQHLDIPRAAAAHCVGEFMPSLNVYPSRNIINMPCSSCV